MTISPTWTEERVTRLKELWAEGYSAQMISDDLGNGISRSAVIGRLWREGYSRSMQEISAEAEEKREERRRIRAERERALRALYGAGRIRYRAPVRIAPVVADLEIPVEQRKSLLELTDDTCRWPVGNPGEEDFLFCGAKPEPDCPYCASHMARAYQSSRYVTETAEAA